MTHQTQVNVNKETFIFDFLCEDSWRKYNISMAKALGGVEYAVLLQDIYDMYKCIKKEKKFITHEIYGDQLFFYTESAAWERCAIGKKTLMTAIKKLQNLGVIEVFAFGMPRKNYYRLNINALKKMC